MKTEEAWGTNRSRVLELPRYANCFTTYYNIFDMEQTLMIIVLDSIFILSKIIKSIDDTRVPEKGMRFKQT